MAMTMTDNNERKFVRMAGDWNSLAPFYIDNITDGYDGLKIHISGPKKSRKSGVFEFDLYYGYRNFNESDVWKHLRDNEVINSGLFVADQSEFLDWAAKQSISEKIPSGVRHYIFTSVEDIFEVLAFDEPSFKFSESGDNKP